MISNRANHSSDAAQRVPTNSLHMSERIIQIQRRIGTTPDGFWGPKSVAACQGHLRRLAVKAPQRWPAADQKSLTQFYGAPGDESNLVNLQVKDLGLFYEGLPVSSIRCHRKVAESLRRVLIVLAKTHPQILKEYAGVYNNRLMRGGSLPSLHARGAAIDLWPPRNGNLTMWPVVALMPLEVMEAFASEGWVSAGAFWGRDAMHFQATSIL